MSPLGIKRFVAIVLVLSPWIFIPGLFKDAMFIIVGILLFISTLDLRKKALRHADHQEVESVPVNQTPIIA
jgi:hypothetical protein